MTLKAGVCSATCLEQTWTFEENLSKVKQYMRVQVRLDLAGCVFRNGFLERPRKKATKLIRQEDNSSSKHL